MSLINFPVGPIEDDSGVLVPTATVTVTSIKTVTGTTIVGATATVYMSDSNCTVAYDAVTYGEAWIVLAVSATGHTFSGKLGAPAIFCSLDPARIASTAAVDTSIAGLIWTGAINDGAPTTTGFTIIATGTSNLTSLSNIGANAPRTLAMTSGTMIGEESIILTAPVTGHITFSPALSGVPANGDTLVII